MQRMRRRHCISALLVQAVVAAHVAEGTASSKPPLAGFGQVPDLDDGGSLLQITMWADDEPGEGRASRRCDGVCRAIRDEVLKARANSLSSGKNGFSSFSSFVLRPVVKTLETSLRNKLPADNKPGEGRASRLCGGVCQDIKEEILTERAKSTWNVYYSEIADLLRKENAGAVAEIGTAWGGLAAHLVEHVPHISLHAIDPFLAGYDPGDTQSNIYTRMMSQYGVNGEQFSSAFATAMESDLQQIATTSQATYQLHHRLSTDAVREFKDASLDAVFVDGLHTYDGVVADIQAYKPKLKKNGLFIFNDYGTGMFPGVTQAVDELARPEGKEIVTIGQQSHGNVYIRM